MAIHTHPALGPFTHDPSVDWWSGEVTWLGEPIALHLEASSPAALPARFETALALLRDPSGWTARLVAFAVADQFEVYNDVWAEGGELTPEGLAARLKPKSIIVRDQGEFDFIFTAGDTFGGHDVAVLADLCRGPTSADLQG